MSTGKTKAPPAVRMPKAMATAYSRSWLIETAMRSMPSCSARAQGPVVEAHRRLAGGQAHDLDLAPADAADARGPSTLLTASLAAQRPARFSGRSRT